MHEPDDENYQRGYEWWLMMEAKKVSCYCKPNFFMIYFKIGIAKAFDNMSSLTWYHLL